MARGYEIAQTSWRIRQGFWTIVLPAIGSGGLEYQAKERTMPHVIVKLWPGKSEQQKVRLAEKISQDVMHVFHYGEESVSVAFEEIKPEDWAEKVYIPDIVKNVEKLHKKPGYTLADLS
jgi:4-oxalocrotonate tautomerase